jgi:hypothetical protein
MDRIGYLVAEYPAMPTENAPLAPWMQGQGFDARLFHKLSLPEMRQGESELPAHLNNHSGSTAINKKIKKRSVKSAWRRQDRF